MNKLAQATDPGLKARADGYDANVEGRPACFNPYDVCDPRHEAWQEGWEVAEMEMLELTKECA